MKLNTYILTIIKSETIDGPRIPLFRKLLETLGAILENAKMEEISDKALESWLDEKNDRNFNAKKYFKSNQIYYSDFISYFRGRTKHEDKWKKLQKSFWELIDSGIVNTSTNNMEVFYQSLLAQFLVLINLPVPIELDIVMNEIAREQIERINQDNILDQAHKLFNRARLSNSIVYQLHEIFVIDGRGYRIGDFVRKYIRDRIKFSNIASGDSLNNIHGLIQTIYENCLETETYNETTGL